MEQEKFNMVILTASQGHKLTQTADVDDTMRIIASRVTLGAGTSPDDWREVTDTEAADMETRAKEARSALSKERIEARRTARGATQRMTIADALEQSDNKSQSGDDATDVAAD